MAILVRLLGLLVFAAVVAVGMIVAFTGAISALTGWMKVCHEVAQRFHGYCSFSWWGRPQIRLRYSNVLYVLRYPWWNQKFAGDRTELTVHGFDWRVKMWIGTRPPDFRFWEGWRMRPVELKDGKFTHRPLAFANQPEIARRMLSRSALTSLGRIQALAPDGHFEVSISQGKLTLSLPGHLRDALPLEQFLRVGIELHQQFQHGILGEGIEFISTDEVRVLNEIICPICGVNIQRDLVTCTRCLTPHCRECWEYNGKCATYACGETTFHRSTSPAGRVPLST